MTTNTRKKRTTTRRPTTMERLQSIEENLESLKENNANLELRLTEETNRREIMQLEYDDMKRNHHKIISYLKRNYGKQSQFEQDLSKIREDMDNEIEIRQKKEEIRFTFENPDGALPPLFSADEQEQYC